PSTSTHRRPPLRHPPTRRAAAANRRRRPGSLRAVRATTDRSPARRAVARARMSRARSIRSPDRLLSVPVARYGPPDDPHYPDDEPTAYINYGGHGPPLERRRPGFANPWRWLRSARWAQC